jgi:hypothetical protein
MRITDGWVVAYWWASVTMSAAGMPVICETRSGGYSRTRFSSCSAPTVYRSTYSRSTRLSRTMTCISPRASAPSVPGRIGMCQSALWAVRVRTGSITTTFAPRCWASAMNGHRWRFVLMTLHAQSTM